MTDKAVIMDVDAVNRAISRICYEILERFRGVDDICIIGIQRRGVSIAKRIVDKIYEIEGKKVDFGILDITFYRDDLSELSVHPVLNDTNIEFSVDNKKIILVDDVLFTGRTIRSAIDAIFELGRPKSIALAVLIDRGHRELPFKADFIGKNLPTSKNERVDVLMPEFDNEQKVVIRELK